jgi:hypothetical protein
MQVEAFFVNVQVTETGRDRAHERRRTRINQGTNQRFDGKVRSSKLRFQARDNLRLVSLGYRDAALVARKKVTDPPILGAVHFLIR